MIPILIVNSDNVGKSQKRVSCDNNRVFVFYRGFTSKYFYHVILTSR